MQYADANSTDRLIRLANIGRYVPEQADPSPVLQVIGLRNSGVRGIAFAITPGTAFIVLLRLRFRQGSR